MGRPEFSQPGTQGGGQTVAVQNRPAIRQVDESHTANVAAGQAVVTEIYAPAGSVWSPLTMNVDYPPPTGAASGSHHLRMYTKGGSTPATGTQGKSAYTDAVRWAYGYWFKATDYIRPIEDVNAHRVVTNLRATENEPFAIRYKNSSDVVQDNEVTIVVTFEEESY